MSLKNRLALYYKLGERKNIEILCEDLRNKRDELNQFFEEYLELFDEKMSAEPNQKSPVWKAYKTRYKEWEDINSDLKTATYYLGLL